MPGSIVNNPSSIVNRRIPCSPGPLQPDPLIPRSPSVSCLLYSAFYPCPLSSPSCRLCPRLLCSSAFLSLVQIRANSWFTLFPVSSWLQVNCAKQTQFRKPQNHPNLICDKNLQQYCPPPQAEKQTQTNPICPPQYAIRNTRYEKQTQTNPIRRGVASGEAGTNPIRRGEASGEAGTNPIYRGEASGEAGFPRPAGTQYAAQAPCGAIRNTRYDIRLPRGGHTTFEIQHYILFAPPTIISASFARAFSYSPGSASHLNHDSAKGSIIFRASSANPLRSRMAIYS